DVVDQLQHVHGLAHAGAAEQADLPALGERADQVDNLDAGLEQLDRGREFVECGCFLVDRAALVGFDRAALVDGASQHVHDPISMLLISSSMFTVLPTPAPPNRPTFPPLANGQTRSITLMPVSSSSTEGESSSNAGASWWIERRSSDSIGPRSSMGRPSTSMIRPSVPLPTGTEIGAPVDETSIPRRSPSLEPMAMVRTTPSPSCCWTSKVRPFSA